jgi:hypothetical protein
VVAAESFIPRCSLACESLSSLHATPFIFLGASRALEYGLLCVSSCLQLFKSEDRGYSNNN